jgi:hypothetical protein
MDWFKLSMCSMWFFTYAYLAITTHRNQKVSEYPMWPRCMLEPKYSFHSLLIGGAGHKVTSYIYWVICLIGSVFIIVLPA